MKKEEDKTRPGVHKPPLLILAGPTAVGKSALALELAPRLGTEIICADSAQVYRGLDIGTAKPSPEEQKMVPHHLIDLVDPDCCFSVADYQKAAFQVIEQTLARGRLPFLVGGTGLYIKAVTEAYAFGMEGKNAALRERLAEQASTAGLDTLYNRLRQADPGAAEKIHPNDQRRIIRALEVLILEGQPISAQVARTIAHEAPYHPVIFGLTAPREQLYRRIEERVEGMLRAGFLDEVKSLLDHGFSAECPGLQILGYRQLVSFLQGKYVWEETVEEIKMQTRRLAKRQFTWFRREERIHWIDLANGLGISAAAEIISKKLKEILPRHANSMS